MTKLSKKKAEIKAELIQHGWVEDRWGHMKKEHNKCLYRVRFQKTSIRFEIKRLSKWINIRSGLIRDAEVKSNGSIQFMHFIQVHV